MVQLHFKVEELHCELANFRTSYVFVRISVLFVIFFCFSDIIYFGSNASLLRALSPSLSVLLGGVGVLILDKSRR